MTDPKVSVLIITCNRPEMLKEAIESVEKQTYKNIETVVIDDGVLKLGIAGARNKALETMTGDYFFMFCDDDTLHPEAIEKMVKAMEGHDIVFSHLQMFGEGKGIWESEKQNFHECLRHKKMPGAGLYRGETLEHFRYNPIFKSACDYDFILNILSSYPQVRIKILPEPLYNYRIHKRQERGTERESRAAYLIRQHYANKRT